MKKLLLQVILYVLLPTFGVSQSTFVGTVSQSWTEANNWNPVGVPADGTEITVESTGGNNPIIPSGTYSYSGITIKDGYELTIDAGSEVTVTGAQISNLGKLYVSGQLLGTGANTILRNGSTGGNDDEIYFYDGSLLDITGKLINYKGSISTNKSTITVADIDNSASWALRYSTITFDNNTIVNCSGDVKNNYGTISITDSEITANSLTNNANVAPDNQIINLTESSATFTGFIGSTNNVLENNGIFNIYGNSSVALNVPDKVGYIYFKNTATGIINIKPNSDLMFSNRTLGNFGTFNVEGNISGTFRFINGSKWVSLGTTTISSASTINILGNIVNTYGNISINGGKLIGDFIFHNGQGLPDATYKGTLNIEDGSTLNTTLAFHNSSGEVFVKNINDFTVNSYNSNIDQQITFTGTTNTSIGAITNKGIMLIKSNSTINCTSGASITGELNIESGSSIILPHSISTSAIGIINNYGNIDATGDINSGGTINLFNNSITKTSSLNNQSGAIINFDEVNNIQGRLLNNDGGLLSISDGSSLVVSGDFLNIADLSSSFIGGTGKSVVLTVGGNFTNGTATSKFNIESSKMSIGGNFTNEGEFTLESSSTATSSLIVDGTSTNTGTLNIQRYLHDDGSGNGKWQLVSSPVSAEESEIFTGHFLNKYDEGIGEFDAIFSQGITLTPGEGYVSKLDFNNTDLEGIPDKPNPIVYHNSILNTDDVPMTLGITDVEDGFSNTYFEFPIGFHLVGNPYTSNINWDDIYNKGTNGTNISKFLYSYVDDGHGVPADENNPIAGEGKDGWTVYDPTTTGPEKIIAMGQGFGVVMIDNTSSKSFTIPKGAKTHDGGTSFNKKSSIKSNSFKLIAKSNNIVDDIKFSFNENASRNYDVEYDAFKLKSFGTSPTPSFITDDGYKLAICEMPYSETVDLAFSMRESGDVTFSIENIQGFSEIIIEDTSEEITVDDNIDLLNDSYTFKYSTDEAETGRFKLHFKQEALSEVDDIIRLKLYSNGRDIYLNNSTTLTNVDLSIYSISGQLVYSKQYSTLQNDKIETNLKGIYILRLTSDQGISTSKLSLK